MRETLLEFFKKSGKPHRLEEILHRFGLSKREAKAYLKALVREGLLEKKGSQYFLPSRVQGPISLHRDGYGFVRLPEKDLFIPRGTRGTLGPMTWWRPGSCPRAGTGGPLGWWSGS
jgi:ribonuclease R